MCVCICMYMLKDVTCGRPYVLVTLSEATEALIKIYEEWDVEVSLVQSYEEQDISVSLV